MPVVGIHGSPGLVAPAGWQCPARVSSPWARLQAALCSALCLLCSWWKLQHQREDPIFCLPAFDMGRQRDLLPRSSCPLSMVTVTSSIATHTASTSKKAQFLMLGYSTLGSGEQTLFAPLWFHRSTPTFYTEASLIQSSLYAPFPLCISMTPPNFAQLLCTWSTKSASLPRLCVYIFCYQAFDETASSSLPVLWGFDDSNRYSHEQSLLQHTHTVVSAGSSYSSI